MAIDFPRDLVIPSIPERTAEVRTTQAYGVFQSDIIIRSAIMMAIQDLRANPYLLDYVFASLAQDELTRDQYGEKLIRDAKDWFKKTKISVFMSTRIDAPDLPAISIKLNSSVEDYATLGDINYITHEDIDTEWPSLCDPFYPVSFSYETGIMVVPDSVANQMVISEGLYLIDKAGNSHVIDSIIDDTSFKLEVGPSYDFSMATIKGVPPMFANTIEGLFFKESYLLGCHAQGDPTYLVYLHSIMVFCLLRYKQAYLEARGFERSTIQSTDFLKNDAFEQDNVYTRFIQVTGFVRQTWPKQFGLKVQSLLTQPIVTGAGRLSIEQEQVASWIGDLDSVDGIGGPVSGSTYLSRQDLRVYWGAIADPGVYTAAWIQALPGNTPSPSRQRTIGYSAGAGQYLFYVYPTSYGGVVTDFIDVETGFPAGMSKVATGISVLDPNGQTVNYDVWRSDVSGLGSLTIEIV